MSEIRKARAAGVQGVVYDITSRPRSTRSNHAEPVSDFDEAGITHGGRELARALAIVRSAADVRIDRVRALQAQIANGAYEPDPRQIARAILGRGF